MFEQWNRLKAANPTALLFFRMGDFYELFFDDAKVAARELDLTLTARNKQDPDPIPMAGVPHHAAGGYIQRLIEAGHRVAIAEQVEDPALAKGLVKREITRIVTPGVVLDPTQLDQRTPNYLAAVTHEGETWGVALLDCSTGELKATEVASIDEAGAEIARLEPREILYSNAAIERDLRRWSKGMIASPPVDGSFDIQAARGVVSRVLGGLPAGLTAATTCAVGAALAYGLEVSGGELDNVSGIDLYRASGFMVLDDTTRRNLELFRTLRTGKRRGSLLHLLDQTVTAMGGRRLREWMAFPLLSPHDIALRREGVSSFVREPGIREEVRSLLAHVSDIERIVARVTQGTAHARDLAALGRALDVVPDIVAVCHAEPGLHAELPSDLMRDVKEDIQAWLVADPPQILTEGGLVPAGAHAELDRLTQLSLDGLGILTDLEEREREASGIASLKLRNNKVFGFYLEVTRAHLHKVPERWLRKQTLTNCERFITPELKELEDQVLGADDRRKRLELELFVALRERVGEHAARLGALARKVSNLDAMAGLAEVAVARAWSAPEVDDSHDLEIEGGEHPVVADSLEDARFVPNDVSLGPERQLIVLTGPNMAGKSTVMRQSALIVLLAQMGSYVPARSARIGLVDRIFTRVGASDDLGSGQSTFMVEMAETATILHEATSRSFVLLDEIGRGTSTYDGLSIAWAVAEHLAQKTRCRAIFATHYHELCDLAADIDHVVNQSVAVSELGEEIVFLRRLREGGASRSYGIQCARLAGLPTPVVARARSLLKRFEKHAPRNERQQLSLFGSADAHPSAAEVEEEAEVDALRDALRAIDPDSLSPREAHDALYRLRELLEASDG
ncbi:MAG: DNA mismatch repair protein MutS [Alphaproteobacteria bacterium]|nr:DNA mismatch repair protein MutS [Alphaproteobacteria bacterium]